MNEFSSAKCECGAAEVALQSEPLIRVFCHCTICQAFNQSAYGDVTFFRARDVQLPDDGKVDFKSYSSSGWVQRGKCVTCDKPAVETVNIPLTEKLVVVPTENIESSAQRPDSAMHVFYHRRQADMHDQLPKYSGFMPSQLAFSGALLSRLIRRALKR